MDKIVEKTGADLKSTFQITREMSEKIFVIPPHRTRYLSEIAENNRKYDETALTQVEVVQKLYGIYKTIETVFGSKPNLTKAGIEETILHSKDESRNEFLNLLVKEFDRVKMNLDPYNWEIILTWDEKVNKYKNPIYSFKVRDKVIEIKTHSESLSHSQIPKISLPKYQAWGDILKWNLQENVPGEFPFASGLYLSLIHI